MDFTQTVPSLLDQSTNRMAVRLWTAIQKDDEIARLKSKTWNCKTDEWREVYAKAKKLIRTFDIPDALKKKLARTTYWVELQIKNFNLVVPDTFEEFLHQKAFAYYNVIPKLCWTVGGLIDKAGTASVIAKEGKLDLSFRYKVACAYCMEDLVDSFWEQMTDAERRYQFDDQNSVMTHFWSYLKQGQKDVLVEKARLVANYNTIDHYGFSIAAQLDNESAMDYFWARLNRSQQESHFDLGERLNMRIIPFILAKMTRNQQLEIFATDYKGVLESMISLGRLDLLSKMLPFCLPFLKHCEYRDLLDRMVLNGVFSFETLSNVWQFTPPDSRKEFVSKDAFAIEVFPNFILYGDEDIVQMMLREMDPVHLKRAFDYLMGTSALSSTIQNGN